MTIEAAIGTALILLVFAVILVFTFTGFGLVVDQIQCQAIGGKYFKVLYNEGQLTPEEQGALTTELENRRVNVSTIAVEEASEWGAPVTLEVRGTVDLGVRAMNGTLSRTTLPFRFYRHSLSSVLRGE